MIRCRNTNGLGDDITEAFTRAEVVQELRAGDMEPAQHTRIPRPSKCLTGGLARSLQRCCGTAVDHRMERAL